MTILYSLMISLANTAIWFGRNQGPYDFWFYITVFARYPRSIYQTATPAGDVIRFVFTFILPILVVVTVRPGCCSTRSAPVVAGRNRPGGSRSRAGRLADDLHWSLRSYRSASS
ncbi:MAG: hypothetical protein Ct9H300mP1_09100 [Planctomycetaceae bacterium]|nr:MAG: hypothetical protein Ct9H300mP1_09100 [Planctomycetaceae bacterium]